MTGLRNVVVVVPARDEEDLLPLCLASVRVAEAELARVRPDVTCQVIVVLDICTDATAEVAVAHGAVVVGSPHGRVGAARALGVRTALEGREPAATWVTNTDADTVVPTHWLTTTPTSTRPTSGSGAASISSWAASSASRPTRTCVW